MQLSLYKASIPVLIAGLRNTASFLERGRAYADQAGIDHAAMLGARLAPDMMSLTEQVQRASDTSKGAAVRVGGIENVAMPDTEKTFDELQQRIAATIALLEAVPADAVNANVDAEVTLRTPGGHGPIPGAATSSNSRCPISSSMSQQPTICSGTRACRSASATISAGSEAPRRECERIIGI